MFALQQTADQVAEHPQRIGERALIHAHIDRHAKKPYAKFIVGSTSESQLRHPCVRGAAAPHPRQTHTDRSILALSLFLFLCNAQPLQAGDQVFPLIQQLRQRRPPRCTEPVVAARALIVDDFPAAFQQPLPFQPAQQWIQRAFAHIQPGFAKPLLERVAVLQFLG